MVAAASAPDDSLRAAAIRDSLAPPADTLRELPATDDLGPSARERRRTGRLRARRRTPAAPEASDTTAAGTQPADTTAVVADTLRRDSVARPRTPRKARPLLDAPITGKNSDSLVYDVRNRRVYIYNQGEVTYQNRRLKADYMRIDMADKMIYAYGKADTLDGEPRVTKPEFTEGDAAYQMDTIAYNLDSNKAKIKGVATQQGEGWLIGGSVKKLPDNTVNIEDGKYTTCDETDHPHFYMAMTKAKVIPGKKVVTGPAYLVIEDVPIYFLGIPGGFFPISTGPKSGLLMPSYGEEYSKGFFLRDMGYYFTLGDHADLALRGGFYTLGSWEASAASRYIKRYKYSGSFNMQYSNVKTGEKGEPDYLKQSNFRIQWSHSQDPKANPGSTFSASVNFATSGYSRYSATNLNDILATQTNSSIAWSKNWAGTPFSLSANMAVSQNSQNKSLSVTLPNVVFNVSRVYPFKRRERMGKERWYEKISMQYTAKMTNSVTTTEDRIFSRETLDNMKNGIEHTLPVSASFNLFNYINVSPSFNYNEKWYFKRVDFEWNPVTNRTDTLPAEYGFYRLYNYNASVSTSTTLYGMYDLTKRRKDRKIQAIRHVLTPSIGFSFAPDFGDPRYGYYRTRQTDSTGRTTTYSPYAVNAYGVPSSGKSMSLNFSLSQNLEMKVLSKRDTSGMKKIKLIDDFSIRGSSTSRPRWTPTASRPRGGATTSSSSRAVWSPRGGRSATRSSRARTVRRPRPTTSRASRPSTRTPFTTPTGASTRYSGDNTWPRATTTSRCRGTSASTTRSTTRSTTSTTARRATARTSPRRWASTGRSTSPPRPASPSRAATTSSATSSPLRRSPSRAICTAGRCPSRGSPSATTAAGASTSASRPVRSPT